MIEEINALTVEDRDELKALAAQCFLSTRVTAKVIFPERFYLPFRSLHEAVFEVLDNDALQKVLILAPRGFGKTSLVNMCYPAKKILFQEKKFIVPISATATQAEMQSENLKHELLSNVAVQKMFEPVRSDTFSKEMWVTSTGTAVMPRGRGQQIRGFLYHGNRPDLIIGDDLEDAESVKNEDQRKKTKEWFFADVLNSVDRSKNNWKVVIIGTLLHEAALLMDLANDPSWTTIIIDVCDDNYKSKWPDFMSDADVKKLADDYRRQGLLDVFYREYRNKPVSAETAKFKPAYFKYYEETDEAFVTARKGLENLVLIDPAKTLNPTSADSAIVGVGIDVKTPRIYIRDIVRGKYSPDQLYEETFAMANRIGARAIGIEVTSLNEFIMYPLRTEMIKRKTFYDLVELKARASKEERILGLLPFYRMGYIYHNKACCDPLEAQLIAFPRSRLWDIMDALAYVVEMLEVGERYFEPVEDADDDPKKIEEEYKELEDEKPITGWRRV